MNANITNLKQSDALPLSVLHCQRTLDRSNYETLVSAARDKIEHGAARIIVDMTGTDVLSLAGAIGLYVVGELSEGDSNRVSALVQGVALDQVDGWTLIHQICDSIQKGRLYSRMLIVARGKRLLRSLHELGLSRLMRTVPTLDDAMKALRGQAN